MIRIDPATLLPKLPEGYFWRITKGSGEYCHIQVRKRTFVGSRKVSDCILKKSRMAEEYIMRRAESAMEGFQGRGGHEKFVGDYPPKKL